MPYKWNGMLAITGSFLLASCSSPGPATEPPKASQETLEERQAELIENAVRRAYEAENVDVTEIEMALSPDASRYIGRAFVRDRASGTEMAVDCHYSTDVTGTPELSCDRVRNENAEQNGKKVSINEHTLDNHNISAPVGTYSWNPVIVESVAEGNALDDDVYWQTSDGMYAGGGVKGALVRNSVTGKLEIPFPGMSPEYPIVIPYPSYTDSLQGGMYWRTPDGKSGRTPY